MRFRLSIVLFAALSFSTIAGAQTCLRCVNGTCQQSFDNRCTHGCCGKAAGTACSLSGVTLNCPERSPAASYFTSRMPQQTEGSALRLQYAPAVKAPPVTCGAAAI